MVVGRWSSDSLVVGVSVVTGCWLLLILGPLVDSGNSNNGDRPQRCWLEEMANGGDDSSGRRQQKRHGTNLRRVCKERVDIMVRRGGWGGSDRSAVRAGGNWFSNHFLGGVEWSVCSYRTIR